MLKNREDVENYIKQIFIDIYENKKNDLKSNIQKSLIDKGCSKFHADMIINLNISPDNMFYEELAMVLDALSDNKVLDINDYFSKNAIAIIKTLKFEEEAI